MTRHSLMITYWRDSSQPLDVLLAVTISDSDPAYVLTEAMRRATAAMNVAAAPAAPEPETEDEPDDDQFDGFWK